MSKNNEILIDGAHNPLAASVVSKYLEKLNSGKKIVMLLGMMSNKDHKEFIQIFKNKVHSIIALNIPNQENFIVVYVQGTTDAFGNTGWNVDVVPTFSYVDDVGLFKALIKYFKANYNIDSSKIFSTGMSLGGFMSYRLACELNEINSIGSVTGSMAGYYNCNPPKKTSIIHFHGTSDNTVPYDGVEWSLAAKNAHNFWSVHNECSSQTEINLPDFNGDGRITKRLMSYNCEEERAVELYSLEGDGHIWFNRAWGHDINASELIWQFFKNQQ